MQNMIKDIEINELKLKGAGNLLRILPLQILYTYYIYFIFYIVSVFFEKVRNNLRRCKQKST